MVRSGIKQWKSTKTFSQKYIDLKWPHIINKSTHKLDETMHFTYKFYSNDYTGLLLQIIVVNQTPMIIRYSRNDQTIEISKYSCCPPG